MTKSKLCAGERISPNYTKKRTNTIQCIVVHHMAGVMSAETCCNIFMNPARKASANYCIGKDGEIWCSVPEEGRAWTSGNASIDHRSITIEVSNSSLGPNWLVSDKVYNSLVALCVDICQRYHITPVFTGKKESSTIQAHRWYQSTLCPGPYLYDKLGQLALDIAKHLNMSQPTISAQQETKACIVRVACANLNVRKGPGTNYPVTTGVHQGELYTIVEETADGWGKLKSGAGWIKLEYTRPYADTIINRNTCN